MAGKEKTDKSFERKWRERLEGACSDYEIILSHEKLKPFHNWNKSISPESDAWDELEHALNIFYGDPAEKNFSTQFLERSLQVSERAFEENVFNKGELRSVRFPQNRSRATSAREYARALSGKKFNVKAMLTVADDTETYVALDDVPWEEIEQAQYLYAVRAVLVAGDAERAAELFESHDVFPYHKQEAFLLQALIASALKADGKTPLKDDKLLDRFDKFFDRIRSPSYTGGKSYCDAGQQRFEIGIIRHRWFFSKDGTIDWQQVIEDIRR